MERKGFSLNGVIPSIVRYILLEIKLVVVHFQSKAFNSGCLLIVDVGEGQLIREHKLEGIDHHRVKKWVKAVYMPESTYHRETFPPQRSQIPV
jgi:hypothetical protein